MQHERLWWRFRTFTYRNWGKLPTHWHPEASAMTSLPLPGKYQARLYQGKFLKKETFISIVCLLWTFFSSRNYSWGRTWTILPPHRHPQALLSTCLQQRLHSPRHLLLLHPLPADTPRVYKFHLLFPISINYIWVFQRKRRVDSNSPDLGEEALHSRKVAVLKWYH